MRSWITRLRRRCVCVNRPYWRHMLLGEWIENCKTEAPIMIPHFLPPSKCRRLAVSELRFDPKCWPPKVFSKNVQLSLMLLLLRAPDEMPFPPTQLTYMSVDQFLYCLFLSKISKKNSSIFMKLSNVTFIFINDFWQRAWTGFLPRRLVKAGRRGYLKSITLCSSGV